MVLGLLCQSGKFVYYYLDKTLRIGKKNQTLKIVFEWKSLKITAFDDVNKYTIPFGQFNTVFKKDSFIQQTFKSL